MGEERRRCQRIRRGWYLHHSSIRTLTSPHHGNNNQQRDMLVHLHSLLLLLPLLLLVPCERVVKGARWRKEGNRDQRGGTRTRRRSTHTSLISWCRRVGRGRSTAGPRAWTTSRTRGQWILGWWGAGEEGSWGCLALLTGSGRELGKAASRLGINWQGGGCLGFRV